MTAGLAGVTAAAMAAYIAARVSTAADVPWRAADLALAVLLLAAEILVTVQAAGYLASMVKASRRRRAVPRRLFLPHHAPPVAVLVTSFNESEEVLDDTFSSVVAMDYPAIRLYLLDDSTTVAALDGARRVAERYGASLIHRTDRSGFKAGAINDLLPRLSEPYIAVLDADQRPAHSWLRDVVPQLEENPRLAFVQVPQVYVNTAGLPVAEAASFQQAVFYEYICEGKAASNAMFCCGSNVVLRRDALLSIAVVQGGRRQFFDETSVTEDFATSLRLHASGWESAYVNSTLVVGLAPETLAAYFTQQMRWAIGTLGMFVRMLRLASTRPRALTAAQWAEYLLSGGYYFVGAANLVFMLASVSFLLAGVTPVGMDARVYAALFVPYFAMTMTVFFTGLAARNYSARRLWLGTALTFGTSWIFVKAAAVALLGLRRSFGVTPKAVGGSIPLRRLAPQLAMFLLSMAAAAAGVTQMAGAGATLAYAVTTSWSAYHAVLLGVLLFHFNRPVTIEHRTPLFVPARAH